jgi:hypothetical protein
MTGDPFPHVRRLCAMALLATGLCPAPAMAQEPWGYELPVFGADTVITALYRSQAGAIVMAFSYGAGNSRLNGFYDTGLRKRIAPGQQLTPIPSQPELTNSAGTAFGVDEQADANCFLPYDAVLTIKGAGQAENLRDYLVVWKLPRAEKQVYGCSFATPLQDGALQLRFRGEAPDYYWSARPDVYAVFARRYLVRFDAGGETHFFDRRKHAAMIRADRIAPLVKGLGTVHSLREAQALVTRIETIITAEIGK